MYATDEQKRVVDFLSGGYSVNVDAVAGSGKTSTSLFIARANPNKKILLLTYNARLKFETRDRAQREELSNLEVHTYHSFCVNYYDPVCYRDTAIRSVLDRGAPLGGSHNFFYDLVIVDEAQDLTWLYYELICVIVRNVASQGALGWVPQMCIFGDRFQSIYQYNGSDVRFMLYIRDIFSDRRWKSVRLGQTFRMTGSMVGFVNRMIGVNTMGTRNPWGDPVDYVVCDTFKPQGLYKLLERWVGNPEKIFVLAPSCRSSRSPVRKFANYISDRGINIFVSNDDDSCVDGDITRGKIVFSTFHQVKGLEREVVLLMGFDDSYTTYYNAGGCRTDCISNELYVACTRARSKLIVVHHYKNDYLNFVNKNRLGVPFIRVVGVLPCGIKKRVLGDEPRVVTVTDLTRHLLPEQVVRALGYTGFDTELIFRANQVRSKRPVPSKAKWGELCENVSDINGTAIVAAFEHALTGSISIDLDRDLYGRPLNINLLLRIANRWCCECSGYKYKMNQIKSYDWLDLDWVRERVESLRERVSPGGTFETSLSHNVNTSRGIYRLVGSLDYLLDGTIYEFKCTDSLDATHVLQACLYAYLLLGDSVTDAESVKVYLYNIFNDECVPIVFKPSGLCEMVYYLFETKYGRCTDPRIEDDAFIEKAHTISRRNKAT